MTDFMQMGMEALAWPITDLPKIGGIASGQYMEAAPGLIELVLMVPGVLGLMSSKNGMIKKDFDIIMTYLACAGVSFLFKLMR